MAERIDTTKLVEAFQRVPGWVASGPDRMERRWEFAGFGEAMRFVGRVAQLAEECNHHPEIEIRFRRVRLVLSTHEAGGLTERDFEWAERLEALEALEARRVREGAE